MATVQASPGPRQWDEKETGEQIGVHQEFSDQMPPTPSLQDPRPEIMPSGYYTSWQFIGSYAAIVFTSIALYVSYTMPVSVLSVINADIGPSSSSSIVPLLHTLLKGVMLLLVGRFSDIFGRRWVLITGQALCTIGSIPCALSQNINTLIGGTVIVALGGGVQPLYPLLCQEVVPNKYRGLSQAILTILIFPFMGFGGLLARLLVQNTELGWRWIYWMNAIFCGMSVVLFYFCYRPPKFEDMNASKSKLQQLEELDYVGLALYSGGAVSLLLGFVWSTDATVGGWDSPRVIGLIVAGGVALIAFGLWETYAAPKTPIVPLSLLKLRGYLPIIGVGVVGQMSFYSFNLFAPQIAQRLYTTNNIQIGLISSLANSGLALGEIITGFIWKYLKHTRTQVILSAASLLLFTGLMALINQHRMAWILADIMLAGLSIGWMQLLVLVSCGLVPPAKDIGLAQGFFGSCRNICGSIATSIFVSILSSGVTSTLTSNVPPAVIDAGLPKESLPALFKALQATTQSALQAVPGITPAVMAALSNALKRSYSQSYQTVYLASIAFCVIALICSFFVVDVDHLMTSSLNKRVDRARQLAEEQGNVEVHRDEEKGVSRV